MKRSLTLTLLFTIPAFAFAQFDSLGINTKWCDGKIVHKDNTILKGYIKYNDKLGMIKFKERLEDEERSFVENKIITMEFFDSDLLKYRKFASLNTKSEQSGWTGELFFEIILEMKEFAVLSKLEPVNVAIRARNNSYYYAPTTYKKVGYEQYERICLAGIDGKVEVLLFTSSFEKDKFRSASKIKPYLNKKLMIKHMGSKWQQVKVFVKDNKLKLIVKADLIKALEYYYHLEKEEA